MLKRFEQRLAALEARQTTGDRYFVVWSDDEPSRFTVDGRAVDEGEWHRRVERAGPSAMVIRVRYRDAD